MSATRRQLETAVLSLLEANPSKKYHTYDLAKHFNVTSACMFPIIARLVERRWAKEHKDACGGLYSYQTSEESRAALETRTFVQKPHKFDQAMIDRMNQIKADRVTLPSKTNTDDAGELSEMDRTKLRMMGSGN